MQVHIFRGEGRVFGFTPNNDGSNLPAKHGPWSAFKSVELVRGRTQPGVNIEECLDDIEQHGLHVTDAHIRITEQAMSAVQRVRLVEPGRTYLGKQGFSYGAGASRETVGAESICLNVLPMQPGAKAKAHYHKGIETIAYMLEGECTVYYGERLEHRMLARTGDQTYIPADVPHAPCNESGAPCKWLVVHSSGSDQDGIVLLPELDLVLAAKAPG